MARGQSMFERSRSKASREAYKTAKAVQAEAFGSQAKTHPAFEDPEHKIDAATDARRQDLLASIYTYNPSETIFEIGVRGQQATTVLMKQRRQTIAQHRARSKPKANEDDGSKEDTEITPAVCLTTRAVS
jgi:ATP-dependent RNA helicase DDX54/DBP10